MSKFYYTVFILSFKSFNDIFSFYVVKGGFNLGDGGSKKLW